MQLMTSMTGTSGTDVAKKVATRVPAGSERVPASFGCLAGSERVPASVGLGRRGSLRRRNRSDSAEEGGRQLVVVGPIHSGSHPYHRTCIESVDR